MVPPIPMPPMKKKTTHIKTYGEAAIDRLLDSQPIYIKYGFISAVLLLVNICITFVALAIIFGNYGLVFFAFVFTFILMIIQQAVYQEVVRDDCARSPALKYYHTVARQYGYDPKASFFNIIWFKFKGNKVIELLYHAKPIDVVLDDFEEFFDPTYVRKTKPAMDPVLTGKAEKSRKDKCNKTVTNIKNEIKEYDFYVGKCRDEVNTFKQELREIRNKINTLTRHME